MTLSIKRTALAGAALACFATPVLAQTTPTLEDLQRRMDALSKEIADLKAKEATRDHHPDPVERQAGLRHAGRPLHRQHPAILMMDGGKYFQDDNLPAAGGRPRPERRLQLPPRPDRLRRQAVHATSTTAFIYEFGGSGAEEAGPALRGRR